MWNNLPDDILANIFSFLSADSLARARATCSQWYTCSKNYTLCSSLLFIRCHPPWFLAMPTHGHSLFCYAHNPELNNWHKLSLDFLSQPYRLVASIESLLLLKSANCMDMQLVLCNPFTREFKPLPELNIQRINPVIGIVTRSNSSLYPSSSNYQIFVAGGMTSATSGGATYEPTLEVYDSGHGKWRNLGNMPREIAVRLTVWTPNESAYCNGVLYWMTSARAYSIMSLDVGSKMWRELKVPLADRLEFAALVRTKAGKLALVGGASDGESPRACIWELNVGDEAWSLTECIPMEYGLRLLGQKGNWCGTKCVGDEGDICLYKNLETGMVMRKENADRDGWVWFWIEGCSAGSAKGEMMQNARIRGILLHPTLFPALNLEIESSC